MKIEVKSTNEKNKNGKTKAWRYQKMAWRQSVGYSVGGGVDAGGVGNRLT